MGFHSGVSVETDGFGEFEETLAQYLEKMDDSSISAILKTGADALVQDLLRLPSPRSNISKGSYTHLIDVFSDRQSADGVSWEVGWGKWYGPYVESGTSRSKANPHMKPLFERNKERYYSKMIDQFEK